MDFLATVGPVMTLIQTVPVWGPFCALVSFVLLYRAARMTWGTEAGDSVPDAPEDVPVERDDPEDALRPYAVTCGDDDPRVSYWPGTGGG